MHSESDPQIGGEAVGNRLDVVTHMHGLGRFADELPNSTTIEVDGIPLRVLKLERILSSSAPPAATRIWRPFLCSRKRRLYSQQNELADVRVDVAPPVCEIR